MGCLHIDYNPGAPFENWRSIDSPIGLANYSSGNPRELILPEPVLVIWDDVNCDLNVEEDINYQYSYTYKRCDEWFNKFYDLTEDRDGDTVVFAPDWYDVEYVNDNGFPTKTIKTFWTHRSVEVYTAGNKYAGFLENSYPFNGKITDPYFKYFADDAGSIGDSYELYAKAEDQLGTEGVDYGYVGTEDGVVYLVPFNSIAYVKNVFQGFEVGFNDNDLKLTFIDAREAPQAAPLFRNPDGSYIDHSMYWRNPSNSKMRSSGWYGPHHFIQPMAIEETWVELKNTWEAIAAGADAYNDLFSLEERQARRAQLAARRAARKEASLARRKGLQ